MSYEKLSAIARLFRIRQEDNRDVITITTGDRGDGKSNFSMQMAIRYVEMFGLYCPSCKHEWITTKKIMNNVNGQIVQDPEIRQPCPECNNKDVNRVKKFSFFRYMGYDGEEFENKIYELPENSPLLGDEAARFALSEDWNQTQNKRIKKLFIQMRTKRLIAFLNLPHFSTLDSKHRNMASYWVRIIGRDNTNALALFLRKDKGEVVDQWHIKEIQHEMGQYFENTPMDQLEDLAFKLKRKLPVVYDYFKVPPLPKAIYGEYEKYRNQKVFERKHEENIDQKQLAKIMLYNLLKKWKTLQATIEKSRFKEPTYKIIEDILFRDPQTAEKILQYSTLYNWHKEIEAIMNKAKA